MTAPALTDAAARLRALNDHSSTLLVEAAAGTGKTALIAGRIAMMMAQGIEPKHIAAVTFGEYAASELSARVGEYVEKLHSGVVPPELEAAFDGKAPSPTQIANLKKARAHIDELICSTIHAFCQTVLTAHAIDADVDPGARVIDEQERRAVLGVVFDNWLDDRLSRDDELDDPIACLAKEDPRGIIDELREIAMLRVEHRTAAAPKPNPEAHPDRAFAEAVAAFRAWYATGPEEEKAGAAIADFEHLAEFFGTPFDGEVSFAQLWRLVDPPRVSISQEDKDGISRNLVAPRLEIAWRAAAGRKEGPLRHDAFQEKFAVAADCYARLVTHIGALAMWRISNELDGLMSAYQAYKRRAALLDFDDLLCFARDLVRDNEAVRVAVAARFQHILVDEFQDTDPVQAELLFRTAAVRRHENWGDGDLKPGALFMVGDPKQAIYGFRGGDVATYRRAREAVARRWPENLLLLTNNFRSRPAIIGHVNACFEQPFEPQEQPDYVPLVATLGEADHDLPTLAKLTIDPEAKNASALRDEEARLVADFCRRLIGAYPLKGRKVRPGDIALVAPRGTELSRYERALQAQNIPFVSQAGKSLLKGQEAQDFLAVARTLANRRDFVAFGALLRGPLVGLSEAELLDIAAALPAPERGPRLSMFTDADQIEHPLARDVLTVLQQLSARARDTTPLLILSEALERLHVRATLADRETARGERSWANMEALLERARPYGVSGMRRFALDLHRDWKTGVGAEEGRLDAEGDALQIITMHKAKGLEWPVVIPINAVTGPRRASKYMHRGSDDTLHWIIGGVQSPELAQSMRGLEQDQAFENVRLWYVACTRARELLVVPKLEGAKRNTWAHMVNLQHARLPEWDMERFAALTHEPQTEAANPQTRAKFAAEAETISANVRPVSWRTPSAHDPDRLPVAELMATEIEDAPLALPVAGAGRLRGLVLHKLTEEVLTGETPEAREHLHARAALLVEQLAAQSAGDPPRPDPAEMAETVLRTLALPDIANVRSNLHPEFALFAELGEQELLAGRADAVAFEDGLPSIVFDWKSDVAPTEQDAAVHAAQLRDYISATGAGRGAVVYMSTGAVRWVSAESR